MGVKDWVVRPVEDALDREQRLVALEERVDAKLRTLADSLTAFEEATAGAKKMKSNLRQVEDLMRTLAERLEEASTLKALVEEAAKTQTGVSDEVLADLVAKAVAKVFNARDSRMRSTMMVSPSSMPYYPGVPRW